MPHAAERTAAMTIRRYPRGAAQLEHDSVALEEPLEIRLDAPQGGRRVMKSVSITMRTPGNDEDLAIGFLVGEGILRDPKEISSITSCDHEASAAQHHGTQQKGGARQMDAAQQSNTVTVRLRDDAVVHWPTLERHFYATSSCGVCGKSSLQSLLTTGIRAVTGDDVLVSASILCALPASLRSQQAVFETTGGLHATGLFDTRGDLLALREDVGRHNALDKVLGARFLRGEFPLSHCLLCLSGRASFELLQKAAVAGVPIVAAIGAPSSAAVELAIAMNITLIGFLRHDRFNVYHGATRVRMDR